VLLIEDLERSEVELKEEASAVVKEDNSDRIYSIIFEIMGGGGRKLIKRFLKKIRKETAAITLLCTHAKSNSRKKIIAIGIDHETRTHL
jgi:hypothetical protein